MFLKCTLKLYDKENAKQGVTTARRVVVRLLFVHTQDTAHHDSDPSALGSPRGMCRVMIVANIMICISIHHLRNLFVRSRDRCRQAIASLVCAFCVKTK